MDIFQQPPKGQLSDGLLAILLVLPNPGLTEKRSRVRKSFLLEFSPLFIQYQRQASNHDRHDLNRGIV